MASSTRTSAAGAAQAGDHCVCACVGGGGGGGFGVGGPLRRGTTAALGFDARGEGKSRSILVGSCRRGRGEELKWGGRESLV